MKKTAVIGAVALPVMATVTPVFAETTTVSDVNTAMSTAVGTIASDAMSAIATVVPIAAPILGAFAVIGIALYTYRKFTGKKGG